MEIVDKLLLESSFRPKNPNTLVSNINITNIENEIIWVEHEKNKDINVLYKKVLVNEFTGEITIDYSLKSKNYETKTITKIVRKWITIFEKTKQELEIIAKESTFIPYRKNEESIIPSKISIENAKDEILWEQQNKNKDIKIEYINNSFVADDQIGSLKFKFKLGKKINNKIIWTNEIEIKNPILGYKTKFQVDKEKMELLKKQSTFSIINSFKIPSQITKQNLENEIVWDQQIDNKNVKIEFLNFSSNDVLGSIDLDYKLICDDIEVKQVKKQIIGWQTTEQHLNEILKKANFNVLDRNRLASAVTENEVIWNEKTNKKNEKVLIDTIILEPNDDEGILNLKVFFSKDNIKKELNTNIENNKSIRSFRTISSYINEIKPKNEIRLLENSNKLWSSNIKNVQDLLKILRTQSEQELFHNSFIWDSNKYNIEIEESQKHIHNFLNGSLVLFFKVTSKYNSKITKTFHIELKGFKTLLDLTNEIPSKININSSDININEINESNFSNILDWDEKLEITNKIPMIKNEEKIYLTKYELISKDIVNKKIEFKMVFTLNKKLKHNNIEFLPNEKSFFIEAIIFVDNLKDVVNYLQNFVFERKEINIDDCKTIKVLSSIGEQELSNLGNNFNELNKILKKEFKLPHEQAIEISFGVPKLQEENNINNFIIIVFLKWKGTDLEVKIPITIFNYFPKKWENFLSEFYKSITSKKMMIDKAKYKKSKKEFIKEWNSAKTTEKRLDILKSSLLEKDFLLVKNILNNNLFDITFSNAKNVITKEIISSSIEIDVFVKTGNKFVEYPSWPTQIILEDFLT